MLNYCCIGAFIGGAICVLGARIIKTLSSDIPPKHPSPRFLSPDELATMGITIIAPIGTILGAIIGGIAYVITDIGTNHPRILGVEWDGRITAIIIGIVLIGFGAWAERDYKTDRDKESLPAEFTGCLALVGIILAIVGCISSCLLIIRGY